MPIYEYTCNNCNNEFELLVRGEEKPACPSCGKTRLTRAMSVPAAHTAGTRDPACPAKNSCGVPRCGSGGCGMANWS